MKKRISAIFLVLCMMVGLLPVNVLAVDMPEPEEYPEQLTVGETVTIDCGSWSSWIGDQDNHWRNSDYRIVQLTNYRPIQGKVDFTAISPGTTTITLYKDKDKTEINKVWNITVIEDNTKSDDNSWLNGRDSFTFSEESSNIDVAYSYVVDASVSPQATSDLIPMKPGETIRLPGLADDYRVAFYVRATKGCAPFGSTFECAGSQGQYYQIGTDPGLPGAAEAAEQHYTKEFSFSSSKSNYPDREFTIKAVPVKVSVVYEGEGVTNTDPNVYTHERVDVSLAYLHTITLPLDEPVRSGYEFKGWEISTDGVVLDDKTVYQAGDTLTLNDTTWVSASEENATVTFTAQWEEKDLNQGGSNDYATIDPPIPTDSTATTQGTATVKVYRDNTYLGADEDIEIKFQGDSADITIKPSNGVADERIGIDYILSSIAYVSGSEKPVTLNVDGNATVNGVKNGETLYLLYSSVLTVDGVMKVTDKTNTVQTIPFANIPALSGLTSNKYAMRYDGGSNDPAAGAREILKKWTAI